MANILFVVPVGQDMGGIITSTEQYVLGLREAGHQVVPLCAVFTKGDPYKGPIPRGKFADDYVPGPGTGWLMHPTAGWRGEERVSLGCAEGIQRLLDIADAFDITIWASMYGFRNPATEGTSDWARAITKNKTRQVFMIHDDHMPDRYPWAHVFAPYGVFVGVQPCSFDSLQSLAGPRRMVYTPLPTPPRSIRPLDERRGFLSCQVWKPWKNADKLVAAAAHMPSGAVGFAGDGIQLRYMRSKDKCPPRYAGLWGAMLKKQGRFAYMGVLNEAERDDLLGRTKFLVDLSLRHNSGQYNRIVQEAMAQGCVVIANPEFISGTTNLFKPDVHYVPISTALYDDPRALAGRLLGLEREVWEGKYTRIQKEARALLKLFARKRLGAELVAAAECGEPRGKVHPAHTAEFVKVFGAKP